MPATRQIQAQPPYRQVVQLARQLTAKDQQKLAKLLATETATTLPASVITPIDDVSLTPAQRKIVANVRQGFRKMNLVKEGKLQTQPVKVLLNELREEGY